MHTGTEYKIISHNVTTSFFICVFQVCLENQEIALKEKRQYYIKEKGKIISMTYL